MSLLLLLRPSSSGSAQTAEHVSSPAAVRVGPSWTGTTAVTSAFSPPAGSMLIVMGTLGYPGSYTATPTLTVTAPGVTFTRLAFSAEPTNKGIVQAVWYAYLPTAPGSIAVTMTRGADVSAGTGQLVVRVVTGTVQTAPAVLANVTTPTGNLATSVSVTPTTVGSQVYVSAQMDASVPFTPVAGTTNIDDWDDSVSDLHTAMGKSSTTTTSTTPRTVGWTNTRGAGIPNATIIMAVEAVPAPVVAGGPVSAGLSGSGTLTANTPNAVLATDTWTGTTGAAWSSQWTVTPAAAGSTATIQANAGRLTLATASNYTYGATVNLTGMPAVRDTDLTVTATFSDITERYLQIMVRAAGDYSRGYGINIYPSNGTFSCGIARWDQVNGITNLSGDLSGGQWVVGTPRKIRIQAIGDTIRVKTWDASASEPAAWLGSVTDTMFTSATGRVQVGVSTGFATTGGYVDFDDLTVTDASVTGASLTLSPALSGAGTLSATSAPATTLPAGLTGSGSLTVTSAVAGTRSVGLTGSGSLTAASAPAGTLPAGLTGVGTLTSASAIAATRSAGLTGSGTLTAVSTVVATRSAGLTGSGALTVSTTVSASRSAAVSGSGSLTAQTSSSVRLLVGNSGADIPGVQNDIVGTWLARNSWENLRDANWLVNNPDYMSFLAAHQDRAADIGVPLIPHDMQWDLNALLDEAVSGTRDAVYTSMGSNLAISGPQTVYARVYWEMNMSPDPANRLDRAKFIAAWQRVVPLIRSGFSGSARAGQTIKIVWCPLSDGAPKMEFWPGGTYVDIVAVDAYASKWNQYTPTAPELTAWVATQLQEIGDIGRAQGKPIAMGEWSNWSSKPAEQGTFGSKGRDDFPDYIDQVFDWALVPANNVTYLCYYNISALGTDQVITDTPLSLARYQIRTAAVQSASATPPATGGSGAPVGATLVSDDGTGANGAALDSAKWALGFDPLAGGSATYQSGSVQLTTGNAGGYSGNDKISRRLNITDAADIDLRFDFMYTGDGAINVGLRSNKPTNDPYEGRAYAISLTGKPQTKYFNTYSETMLGSSTALTTTQSTWYSAHVRLLGSQFSASVWVKGQSEPTTWNAGDVSDTTITAAGSTAFIVAGSGAPNQSLLLDNVVAAVPVAGSPAPSVVAGATLSGTGALAATGAPAAVRSAALSGTGTLTVGAVIAATRSASLTGSGTLAATSTSAGTRAASLSGSGVLSASSSSSGVSTAPLSGSGTLSATSALSVTASAGLSGAGTLSATRTSSLTISAAPSGAGTLTATVTPQISVAASLNGAGTLSGTRTSSLTAGIALSGTGTLTASSVGSGQSGVSLTGAGTLSATASYAKTVSATPAGSGTLSASVSLTRTVLLSGSGTVATSSSSALVRSASLAGSGTLTAVTASQLTAAANKTASGQLTASTATVYSTHTPGSAVLVYTPGTSVLVPNAPGVASLTATVLGAAAINPKPSVSVLTANTPGAAVLTVTVLSTAVLTAGGIGTATIINT